MHAKDLSKAIETVVNNLVIAKRQRKLENRYGTNVVAELSWKKWKNIGQRR